MADEKITTEDLEASVRALLAAKIAYDTETDAALAASEAWSAASEAWSAAVSEAKAAGNGLVATAKAAWEDARLREAAAQASLEKVQQAMERILYRSSKAARAEATDLAVTAAAEATRIEG